MVPLPQPDFYPTVSPQLPPHRKKNTGETAPRWPRTRPTVFLYFGFCLRSQNHTHTREFCLRWLAIKCTNTTMIAVKYNNYFDGNQNKHKILRLKRKKNHLIEELTRLTDWARSN